MAGETILELMTRVNVEPLKAAMTESAAAVSTSTSKMKTDIASFSASSMAANEGVVDFMSKLPPAFIKVEAGGVFAFEQIQRRVVEATSEVGALRQEILSTNDSAKLTQLNAQLDQARARMTAARTEMRAMRLEMNETREKADLLGESVGVKIPGALGRLLGQMPQVQALMNALFAPTLILFFADQINHVVEGIVEMTRAMAGFGEAERKAYESALDHNSKLILSNLELKEKLEAISVIGKEGAAKYTAETKNSEAAARSQAAELGRVNRALQDMQVEVDRLGKKKAIDAGEWITLHGLENATQKFQEAESSLKRLEEERDVLEAKLRERPVKSGTARAEEEAREGEEARAVQRANIEATKTLQTDYVNFYEQGLRRMYASEKITLADEVTGEREAILARLQIERDYAAARKQQLAAEHSATGKDVAPQVSSVNTELQAAEIRTRSELAAIDQRFDQETLQQRNAVNLATVQAAKSTADSEIAVVEEMSRRRFANGQIVLSELTAIEKAAANQRIDEQRAVVAEQLRAANEYPEKNKALIIKLNSDLANLERQRVTQLEAIDLEAESRKRQVLAIEAEAAKAHQQTLLEIERLGIETRAGLGLISGRQRLLQLQAITTQEYQLEKEAIEKKRALYQQGTTQYEQAEKELQQINDRYNKQMAEDDAAALRARFAAWQKFDRQISDGFATAIGEMLRGEKTFGQALAGVWNTMVVDFAQMLTRRLVQWTLQHTAMRVISNIFHLQELTQQTVTRTAETAADTAAQTATVARHTAANAVMAGSDAAYTIEYIAAATTRTAGEAAAETVAGSFHAATDVGEVISSAAVGAASAAAAAAPGGPAAMAAAAAAAEAIIMSFAPQAAVFAARGAVLDSDSLVQAHAREMILPPHISVGLQDLIASGGLSDVNRPMAALHGGAGTSQGSSSSLSSTTNHNTTINDHSRPTIVVNQPGEPLSEASITRAVKKSRRQGYLRK